MNVPQNQTASRTLVLLDGSSYLYRALHALPNLRADPGNPDSAPTGAIRGVLGMVQALARDVPCHLAACVFDAPGPTFRNALYAGYKAQRPPMPEDLQRQIGPIHDLLRLLGWPLLCVSGVEADDVIATLAHAAARQGLEVVISSGDKDLAQLVDEHITVLDTMSGKRRDAAGVLAEFGVPPPRMVDWQALVGDKVDNVPGVAKVGPATATKWLRQYGSLDALVAAAADVPGVVGKNLRAAIDSGQLAQSRQLVTLKGDCDLGEHIPGWPALDALAMRAPDAAALGDFYRQYGFRSLLREMEGVPSSPPPGSSGDLFAMAPSPAAPVTGIRVETILDFDTLQRWITRIGQAELSAIDTETSALEAMRAELVGISLSVQPGEAAYIPLRHSGPGSEAQLPAQEVLARLAPWLEDARCAKVGQHIKYDQHVFANAGIALRGCAHDTMLQSYVLEAHRPHSLTSLALRHLGRGGTSYEDLCGKGAQQVPFASVALDQAAAYAGEDAEQTLCVHRALWPKIEGDARLAAIYALEMAVSAALLRMERNGVCIDAAALEAQSRQLGQRIAALEEEAWTLAGQRFNLASPKQLGEIFFDRLGLPVVKKTAGGARSTDEQVLEQLARDHPLPARLLEHRSLSKLKGTYTDKLAAMVFGGTGRIHTHYAQAVAVTGRLSSNEPNLQNIPIRTEEGRRVREAFIAPPGCLIASADYSQIELRIMAHLCGDEALLAAFHQNLDIHRATAAEIFGVAPQEVSSAQRRTAKVINFGLIYGMGSHGLARALDLEPRAAAAYIERYFARYPGVRRYMDETVAFARTHGWVQTIFGRRLYLADIHAASSMRKKAAERQAINAPMQGSGADLIKKAMIAVQQAIDAECPEVKPIMQVHDELVLELPEQHADWVRSTVARCMAGVARLRVPLVAEVGLGRNWQQAH